jgi:hypothetical protein
MCAPALGCAGTVTTRPTFRFDQYAGEYTLNGARFEVDNMFMSALKSAESTAWLRGIYKPKTSETRFQLVVRHQRDAARFFGFAEASDNEGNALRVEEEKQGTSSTITGTTRGDEQVSVELSREYLGDKSGTGIDVRLLDHNKQALIVKVEAKYVAEFIKLFDESVAQVERKADTPPAQPVATAPGA